MTPTLLQYLIICPLVGLAGFVDAIAGGGGLISLPAYLIAGLPTQAALATNKMSACMGATIAAGKYAKSGFIPWKTAIPCVLFAMLGSNLGARIVLLIDDYYFKRLMLVILPMTALYIYRSKVMAQERPALPFWQTAIIGSAVSFAIGVYDGFYGPGTGAFLMLLLTGLGHLKLTDAAGTTKAVNLTTNVSALVVFLLNGTVMVPLGLLCGLFNVAGSWLGARLFTSKGAAVARPVLLVVLVVFAARVIAELLGLA